jgi:hypothetical protein
MGRIEKFVVAIAILVAIALSSLCIFILAMVVVKLYLAWF